MKAIVIASVSSNAHAESLAALSSPAVLLSLLAVGLLFCAASMTARRLDDARIRQAVERAGGEILQITYIGLFDEWHGRAYEVTYQMAGNVVICATCKTAVAVGVLWTSGAHLFAPVKGDAESSPLYPTADSAP